MRSCCTKLTIAVMTALLFGCAAIDTMTGTGGGTRLVPGEGAVPGVPAEVEYADYWIRNAADPDAVILTPEKIAEFNAGNPQNGEGVIDVLSMPAEVDGVEIRSYMSESARRLLGADLFVAEGIPLERADRDRIAALMDTAAVPDVIEPVFGMTLRRVQGRNWPTIIPLMRENGSMEFDATVGSALDMAQPVALLHTSSDGRWSYVRNSMYTCWLPSDALAFGDMAVIRELEDDSNPVVAVGHRVSVYPTPESGAALGDIQMGSYLPIRTAGTDFFEVLIPGRGERNELIVRRGYVRRSSDVHLGYLPYTLRNVYRQCFTLFGRRYGWAGMFEERDCSRFVMDVFRCFGFKLPRTSGALLEASKASLDLSPYNRVTRLGLINSSPPGITFLGWPGHIMLYLGSVMDTPYVIQATYARGEPDSGGGTVRHRMARVIVGDLLMDEGTQSGARIDRLTRLTIMANYTFDE